MFHTSVKKPICAAVENKFGNKIRRPPRGFTRRHTETEKNFGVHLFKAPAERKILEAFGKR
jgi:hypothetical protein